MTFLLHGATLALAWFLVINLVTSALVIGIAKREPRTPSPAFWFGLRLLPAAAAAMFVAIIFVPSYWRYEPRDAVEGLDLTLAACALAAATLLAGGGARGVTAWRRASRRTRLWMEAATRLRAFGVSAGQVPPTFVVDADAPIMALVGVLRPRLLVTRGLLDALTDAELSASVAHELGHSRSWDNLKRLAMCAAPDLLGSTTAARTIERRWAAAAEHAADRMTGDTTPATRCALASALVKVARLTPPDPIVTEPISTLVGGGDIASRVRDLLDDHAPAAARRERLSRWLFAAIVLGVLAVGYGPLLHTVHDATEILVHSLP